jgi:hypothetical protein
MKAVFEAFVVGSTLICVAGAQEFPKLPLRKGVSVEMAVANHSVEMPAADEQHACVVAITAEGRVFLGIQPTEPIALSSLRAGIVYVKADSRVPYQKILAVLDALRGKSVVLLTAPPRNVESDGFVHPYGMKLVVPR